MARTNSTQCIFASVFLVILSSCASLKTNYLGKANRELSNFKLGAVELAALDSGRKASEQHMDSLVNRITAKDHSRHLAANEINELFSSFAIQLGHARIFNAILHKENLSREQLSDLQYYSAVQLLESAVFFDKCFQKHNKIRRILNRGDAGNSIPKNIIQKSRTFLYSPAVRQKLLKRKVALKADTLNVALAHLPRTNACKSFFYTLYRKNDRIINSFYSLFTFTGSAILGTSKVKTPVKAKQRAIARKLESQLQSYDILLSRNTNHVSAKIIPGYFGHAALWLGADAPQKRKKLRNLFRKDTVHPASINQKGIVEALRSGVQVSSIKEFAEGDVFIIIRMPSLTPEQKKSIVTNAAKQMDKPYDFNFDIESPDMVNCTELIYLSCDFIPWKVSPYMGRYTILPDDILRTALEGKQFEIVGLLNDGNWVVHPEPTSLLKLLQ